MNPLNDYQSLYNNMTIWIPQSGELIIPRTNHFAFIQIPDSFTTYLKTFLIEASCFTFNYTASGQSLTLLCLFVSIFFFYL